MLTIVLAASRPEARPGEELAGLTLGLRAVLTAQKAGATRIVVFLQSSDAGLGEAIRADRRVKVAVAVEALGAGEPVLPAALRLLSEGEAALVVRHDVLVDPAIYKVILSEPLSGALGVVARGQSGSSGQRSVAGPLLVSSELLGALSGEDQDLDATIERLSSGGQLRTIDSAHWAERMDDPESRRRAFTQLFEACRKPVDGLVARHLNRHISLFISKRLVGTKITPNMVSSVTLLLGLLAGVSVARGGYGPILLGAFLWQSNSILDGVDGELARVRFEHSKLGQWLDTISDDLSNVIFWAALAFSAAQLPYGRWLSLSGWITAASNLGLAAVYYVQLIAIGSGDVYDVMGAANRSSGGGWRSELGTLLRYVSKKDFFVLFCLVLALFGVLPYVLPLLAVFGMGAFASALAGFKKTRAARTT